jgi:mRNA interferase MazF
MKIKKYPQCGEIYWVNLDPTVGSEINKKRPALIVSNDIGNEFSKRVIVAPITSNASKIFPFEVGLALKGKRGKILLDQIRTVDKSRLENRIDVCDSGILGDVDLALKKTFALK